MKFLTDILHFALRILQNMANVMETIQNKYKVWHDNIIANGKKRKLIGYKEVHHILPKSLGGSNDKSNLVELTAREHFLVHLLLCKFTIGKEKHKMLYSFNAMRYIKSKGRDYKINSKIAQKLRSQLRHSKETKLKMSESQKGNKYCLGFKHTKESRLKMSQMHKGNKYCLGKKTFSKETKQKLSEIRKQLIWVNNNIQSKRIKKDDIQNYLNIGYKLGRDKSYLTKEYSLKMSKLTQSYWDRRSA
jgi:hypothetical protein